MNINENSSVKSNLIINKDSLDALKEFPSNCVDIIITSPPYNFAKDYDEYKDAKEWKEYFDKLFKILHECNRVLKFGGRLIINVQPNFTDNIPTHHIISNYLMDKGMIWKGEILWDKNNYNCPVTAWGSWKSPSNPYLKYTWELIEVFCKGSTSHKGSSQDIDITGEEFKQFVNAKWNIAPENRMQDFNHPAMFPEQLVERLLKLFSYKNDLVFDPFNGVGTTTFVANKLGRKYIGIDISDKYCDIARKRLDGTFYGTCHFSICIVYS